jgi:hypothetical protein
VELQRYQDHLEELVRDSTMERQLGPKYENRLHAIIEISNLLRYDASAFK